MNTTTTTGLDLAKSVFQVHGVDAASQVTTTRRLKRKDVMAFFAKLPPCLVGMEACGTAHYWARQLRSLGHTVKLMPPRYVKAYLKRGKTDAADAEAICEAVTRPRIKEVQIKTVEQQCALMLHRTRELLPTQRTRTTNAIRAHMAELGLIAPIGHDGMRSLLAIVVDTANTELPVVARLALAPLAAVLAEIEASIGTLDSAIAAQHKGNETSQRLAQVPCVGPLAASAFAATVVNPKAFKSARAFASSLGLTPRLEGTGGKTTLGPITKQGDRYLRRLLYLGAVAKLAHARAKPAKADPWLIALLGRLPFKQAAIALANKTARIIWALLAHGRTYTANTRPFACAVPA